MFRPAEHTRAKLMTIHGLSLLALGVALLYIRASMTNVYFYFFGGAVAILLVAASLLFIAGIDWMCAAGLGWGHAKRLKGLIVLSIVTAACGLFLVFYPGGNIRTLSHVVAGYAFFMSLGKFGLARSWSGTIHERTVMYLLALVALAFSVALAAFAGPDDRRTLMVIAGYCMFMGLQMLLTMSFLQQHMVRLSGPKSKLNQARA